MFKFQTKHNIIFKKINVHKTEKYEGCSLIGILVIDSISLKPVSVPEQKDLVIIDGFFATLKLPNNFRTVQFIIAN